MDKLKDITIDKIINALNHPFYIINVKDYSIELANKSSKLDISKNGIKCFELTHGNKKPCLNNLHTCPIELIKKSGKNETVEHIHFDKNGEQQILRINAVPVFDEKGELSKIIEYSIDITDSKRTELILKENEAKYRMLIEDSNDGIYLLYNNKFEIINKKFQEMFGVTEKYVQNPGFNFMELVSKKSKSLIEERNQALMRGDKVEQKYEFTALRSDGKELEVEVSVSYMKYKKGYAVQGVVRNITERKKMEQKILHLQKMESLGELASGISHDFNNILTAIFGFAEISIEDLPENSKLKYNIEQIISAAERGKDLIEQILSFSKKSDKKFIEVNLESIIIEGMKLMKPLIPSSIKIKTNIKADNKIIFGNPTQLYQILINLCTNASQAMLGENGLIEITLENIEINSTNSNKYILDPGNYLKLEISDTGRGIVPEIQKKIFDPFFTTKNRENGTGLGLSTVHGIVKNHKGNIFVESKEMEGTSFIILFPAINGSKKKYLNKELQLSTGEERILMVDDEKSITEIFEKMLSHIGYSVISKTSSIEALELFKKDKDAFDLVLTDQTMPDLSGTQLAKKIKSIRNDIPVILFSGSNDSSSINNSNGKYINRSIMKPVQMKTLARVIREIIDN